jgi:chromatin remodeling complex protein RSC6
MSTQQADNASTSSSTNNSVVEEVDQLELQWKNMELSLSTFKTQVTALQQQLRALEKATRRQVKQLKKEASKSKNRGNRAPSGFAKPSKISKELCTFMGKEEGAEVARTEVTKFVISYIKENSLAESKDIKPDEKLTELLGIGDEDHVTYFNIQKYMNKHFTKKKKVEASA